MNFLRFLIKDVSSQHEKAANLFLEASQGKKKLFTSTIVVFEIYWVFISFYRKSKKETVDILEKVLSLRFIKINEREIIEKALKLYININLELEDCYNLVYAKENKMKQFATFDKKINSYLAKR